MSLCESSVSVEEYAFLVAEGEPVRNARGRGRLNRLARVKKLEDGLGRVRQNMAAVRWVP